MVSFPLVTMPTSRNKQSRSRQHGFTLLELLIVLALMGLLGSLAVPALGRLIDSLRYRSERSSVIAQINTLSYRNFLLAQDYTLRTENISNTLKDDQPALDLPAGWAVRVPTPVHYQFNGYCSGGVVILIAPDHVPESLRLQAPGCGVSNE